MSRQLPFDESAEPARDLDVHDLKVTLCSSRMTRGRPETAFSAGW